MAKSRGRAFRKGQNSHDGIVHRRGPNRPVVLPDGTVLPKSSAKALARAFFEHSGFIQKLWDKINEAVDDPKQVMDVFRGLSDRAEGKPVQGVELSARRQTIFQLTGDGQVALPTLQDGGGDDGGDGGVPAEDAEDQMVEFVDPAGPAEYLPPGYGRGNRRGE
ncbi:MAG: hypothetical protein ACE5JD_12870 [Candidatus Methylomirabilia bacterium]